VDGLSNPFLTQDRCTRGGEVLSQLALRLGLPGPGHLSSWTLGLEVRTTRSSWVRRVSDGAQVYYIKTYDYPRLRDRLRGALRNTWLRPSRATREWDALTWLRAHDFHAPRPVGVLERRRLGWLHRALVVTEAWPGEPLDRLLPRLDAAQRRSLGAAVVAWVERLHHLGFRDRNLDLRNLLARPAGPGWDIAKIDSPRHRLVQPGRPRDRLAHEDWSRLLPQLQVLAPGSQRAQG
jgi:hypothetical protein